MGAMTQASGRLFDGIGRLMTDAVGAADSVKREIDTVVRSQLERILGDLDLVRREEFEAVRDLAANARTESERLTLRVATLEAKLAAKSSNPEGGTGPVDTSPANAI
jgi:BMFP domain-containing protein YqiC